MTSTDLAIETAGLVKVFGENRAVDGVDLAVAGGHGLRRSRSERRGQDDRGADARHAAAPGRRRGPRLRQGRTEGSRRGTEQGQPHRSVRLGGRGSDRHRESDAARQAPGAYEDGRAGARGAVAGGVRPGRGGGPTGQELLGGYAAPYRHRRVHSEHTGSALPGRADDGPRSAQPQSGVGHRAGGGRSGHDGPADDAVSRRGGPAGVPYRRHRPRQGDRGGYEGRAEGIGGRRFRASAAAGRRTAAGGRAGTGTRARRVRATGPGSRRPDRHGRRPGHRARCGGAGRAGPGRAGPLRNHRGHLLAGSAQPGRGVPGPHRQEAAARRDA